MLRDGPYGFEDVIGGAGVFLPEDIGVGVFVVIAVGHDAHDHAAALIRVVDAEDLALAFCHRARREFVILEDGLVDMRRRGRIEEDGRRHFQQFVLLYIGDAEYTVPFGRGFLQVKAGLAVERIDGFFAHGFTNRELAHS